MNVIENYKKVTETYEKAIQKILDHVGYKENDIKFEINTCIYSSIKIDKHIVYIKTDIDFDILTSMYWMIEHEILYLKTKDKEFSDFAPHNTLLDKPYIGKDFTMVYIKDYRDRKKYFILDNSKQIK